MDVDERLDDLIPTLNRGSMPRATLEAMCRVRRGKLAVEFVVIDNGSTDDTAAVLDEFRAKLPLTCLREPAAGKSRALNRALRDVELGDIVLFTDDDVTPDASWFEAIIAASARWPQHSVFGGRIDPVWPTNVAVPFWAADRNIQCMAFSAHHISDREGPYPPAADPFGPNYWVRRGALAGLTFREDLGPHPRRRTLGDETEFLRQLRGNGFQPIYCASARVQHRIEPERTSEWAIYRRAFQFGRGAVHVGAMPEAATRQWSLPVWHLRLASNIAMGAWQVLNAALDPDEKLRFARVVARTVTLAKNVEALRCAALDAVGRGAKAMAPQRRGAVGTTPNFAAVGSLEHVA